jgi:aspartate kinase
MIVMKFGGTSVEDAASIERVAEIIRARLAQRPVVVVSAMGKTTRRLLEAAESSASGDSRSTLDIIADLKARHLGEARQLIADAPERNVFRIIDQHFDELKKLLEGLAVLGEVPPRGLDKILSYGELLSSAIVAGALRERDIPAVLGDARSFIKTDDNYGRAAPLVEITYKKIEEALRPAIEAGGVPVIQGFIGSTREGATTTLGFEGSDYTAAIVGAALCAEDIQIWKDVSGLMTCDPAIYSRARTVKVCTFAEAAELTFFGAKVLHPKCIHPAAQKNISVHIYNSKQPGAVGTAISAIAPACSNSIKSIAYKRPVTMISVSALAAAVGDHAPSPDEFLKTLLGLLASRRVVPLITTASALNATFAVDSAALAGGPGRYLVEDLSGAGEVRVERRRAIVSVVGEELRSDPAVVGRVLSAIDHVGPGLVLAGSSPIAMSFVVEERDVERVVARLHELFFDRPDPRVFN